MKMGCISRARVLTVEVWASFMVCRVVPVVGRRSVVATLGDQFAPVGA